MSATATHYVINPTMRKGKRRFVFDVSAYATFGGRLLTVRRFTKIEAATAFASRARVLRSVFPVTASEGR